MIYHTVANLDVDPDAEQPSSTKSNMFTLTPNHTVARQVFQRNLRFHVDISILATLQSSRHTVKVFI